MACETDDREGESPSPMEPQLGRMFHSSATGRRHEQLFPRPAVLVKRFPREMTQREVPRPRAPGLAGMPAGPPSWPSPRTALRAWRPSRPGAGGLRVPGAGVLGREARANGQWRPGHCQTITDRASIAAGGHLSRCGGTISDTPSCARSPPRGAPGRVPGPGGRQWRGVPRWSQASSKSAPTGALRARPT
jgi:hypothetical protein